MDRSAELTYAKRSYSSEQLAYLAGIIDGEGTITVAISKGRDGKPSRFRPVVSVANTNRPLMDWLVDIFGGRRYERLARSGKVIYMWVASNASIPVLLDRVRPYLVVKAAQVDLVLSRPPGEIWEQISILNAAGGRLHPRVHHYDSPSQ